MCVGAVLHDETGITLCGGARAIAATVQPVHELRIVIPNGEDESHATAKRLAHRRERPKRSGARIPLIALLCCNRVSALDCRGDFAPILDVLASDLGKCSGLLSVVGDELSAIDLR